jgi:hypothetical protein
MLDLAAHQIDEWSQEQIVSSAVLRETCLGLRNVK